MGRPCRAVGHLVYPSPGSPISQAALPAGLGPRALWLRGGKEGGTGLEGGKSDAKEKMHFLMTQSSRIRSLLASWMPPALSLGWSPPPDASPALTQHIPLPHPASRGPLAHGESPILKGQRIRQGPTREAFLWESLVFGATQRVCVAPKPHPGPTCAQQASGQKATRGVLVTSALAPWHWPGRRVQKSPQEAARGKL